MYLLIFVSFRLFKQGLQMFLGYIGITAGSFFIYYLSEKQLHREEVENRSATNVIYPLLLAERDR